MKRSGLTPHLASATLFLVLTASGLPAQENKTSPASVTPNQRVADLMKRIDKDGDGKLDDRERAEAKELLLHEKIDLQSSYVPSGEGSAMMAPAGPEGFRQRMMEMFDKNQDGRLDEQERAAAEKFAAERGLSGKGDMREEVMRRFDQNGNGRIDPEEREATSKYLRERMEKGAPPAVPKRETSDPAALENALRSAIEKNEGQLRRFDADNNGKLDDKEWNAARGEIQRWANGDAAGKAEVERSPQMPGKMKKKEKK